MPILHQFPYANTHDQNYDWILAVVKDFQTKYSNFDDAVNDALNRIAQAVSQIDEAKEESLAELESALSDALTAVNTALENAQTAINSGKEAALSDIDSAKSGAITDITTAKTNAIADIDTEKADAISDITDEKVGALESIDSDLQTALQTLQTSLFQTLTALHNQETILLGRITNLLSTLPDDSQTILSLFNVILSMLNGNWVYTTLWEQYYYSGNTGIVMTDDPTYLSSTTIGSQGCAGRRLQINCEPGYYIHELSYWEVSNNVQIRHTITMADNTSVDTQVPFAASFFSITIRKTDHSTITASDVPGNVYVEWPMNALEVPSIIAYEESNLTASRDYNINNYFIYNGNLYKTLAPISQYDTLIPSGAGQNCQVVNGGLGTELAYVNNAIYGKQILNFNNVRSGYLSGQQGGDFTILASSNTSVIVGIINVVKGMKYKIAITYGASIASAPQRYSNIVDSTNTIVQRITIPAAVANTTEYIDFIADDNGFLALALDKKFEQVTIYSDEVKTNIEVLEEQAYTELMKAAQINCYRSIAWTVSKGNALTTAFCKSVGCNGWIDVKPNTDLNSQGNEVFQEDGSRQASQFISVEYATGDYVAFDGFLLDNLPEKLKIAVRCYDENHVFIGSASKPDGTTGPGDSTLKRTFFQDVANNKHTKYIRILFVIPDGSSVTDLAGVYTGRMFKMNWYNSANEITSEKYAFAEVEVFP